jgi:hypothetical protein
VRGDGRVEHGTWNSCFETLVAENIPNLRRREITLWMMSAIHERQNNESVWVTLLGIVSVLRARMRVHKEFIPFVRSLD